uniref:Sorting nexin N-terminal domain-containing protein n=1 Tax=Chrysemys picta bellii TaxID=8478 RepID=A0A8C3FM18_CHRPI
MASGGACSSSPSAERLPPPFPRAEGDVDSDTEGEDIFTGAVSPPGPWGSRALLRRCPRVAPESCELPSEELPKGLALGSLVFHE